MVAGLAQQPAPVTAIWWILLVPTADSKLAVTQVSANMAGLGILGRSCSPGHSLLTIPLKGVGQIR